MPKALFTIAFDLGGVIFDTRHDVLFGDRYLETTLNPGMYDLIADLAREDDNKLVVISKAFPAKARKSREILRLYGLDAVFNSLIFCEDDRAKAPIARALGVDVLIDDKEEVLRAFSDGGSNTVLFRPSDAGVLRLRDTLRRHKTSWVASRGAKRG